jgi:hypothetical protein
LKIGSQSANGKPEETEDEEENVRSYWIASRKREKYWITSSNV